MTTYLTNKEIHVCGLQRTGQHAILTWIIGHFGKVFWKNGMTPKQDKCDRCLNDGDWWRFDTEKRPDFSWDVCKNVDMDQEAIIMGTEYTWPSLDMNPRIPKEREELAASMGCDQFSKEQHYVLVLRSPYNHLASWLKMKGPAFMAKRFSSCWIAAAEEFLGETNKLPSPKVCVNYDKWFMNEDYRKDLSKQLNIPFSDKGLNTIMHIGHKKVWGSSFDLMKYNGEAQKMKPTERWVAYKDDAFFLGQMKDKRLRELSEQIFGEFPV